MISTLLALPVHWFLLVGMAAFVLDLAHPNLYGLTREQAALLIPTLILGALFLTGISPVGEWVLRRSAGCKKLIEPEAAYLYPLFEEVCQRAGVSSSRYRLYIYPSEQINAFAQGRRTIAISRPALNILASEEMKGMLAHELGHHVNCDTFWLTLNYTTASAGNMVLNFYALLANIAGILCRLPIPLINFALLLFNWLMVIQLWLVRHVVFLPLNIGAYFGGRRDEYKADEFAARIGCGGGLALFFRRIIPAHKKEPGVFGFLFEDHPAPHKRLERLAKLAMKE